MFNAQHLPAGRQEIPNHKSKKSFTGVWGFGFGWSLEFGHWDLQF